MLDSIAQPAPSSQHYLSVTDIDAVDAMVFAHELEDVCAPVRAADVLFFGDSRMQFALPRQILDPYFARRGLRYYLLGFPEGRDPLAHRILGRCDAYPRLVVVQEGNYFTGSALSWDKFALESNKFEAIRRRLEFVMAFEARHRIHKFLPHPVGRDLTGGAWVLYRSVNDGTWHVAAGNQSNVPVPDPLMRRKFRLPDNVVTAAQRFQAEIDRRGGDLVMTFIPSRYLGRNRARTVAAVLNVPFVAPAVPNLYSADGFHLQRSSAERFAGALLQQLEPLLPTPLPQPED